MQEMSALTYFLTKFTCESTFKPVVLLFLIREFLRSTLSKNTDQEKKERTQQHLFCK